MLNDRVGAGEHMLDARRARGGRRSGGARRVRQTLFPDRARVLESALVREAAVLQQESALAEGEGATRRFELLRLQFKEDLSIAEIAARWNVDAQALYKEAARAKLEFQHALRRVVSFHHPGAPELVERECRA